jgi:hypothetical protein
MTYLIDSDRIADWLAGRPDGRATPDFPYGVKESSVQWISGAVDRPGARSNEECESSC